MARRMFSPQIIDSDAFLDMPVSARELYFQLGMRADDDGFVGNPKKIIRMIGASDDDLKVLLTKRFVLIFESGVIVIKHWRINNLIRKDWYKETVYQEEKQLLTIKENGSYTENNKLVNENVTNSVQSRSRRLGKVRLGKVNNIILHSEQSSQINDFIKLFEKLNPNYEILFKNKTQRSASERLLKKYSFDKLSKTINACVACAGKSYAPTITTPVHLEEKLGALIRYYQREENKSKHEGGLDLINLK